MLCDNCNAKIPTPASRQKRVNDVLHKLGLEYHSTLSYSLNAIDAALKENGFKELGESGSVIATGTNGAHHEMVGEDKWCHISWYRRESGNYEVVAYVN